MSPQMTKTELVEVLKKHEIWLAGRGGGRANLSMQDLSGLKLSGIKLRKATLTGIDLSDTVLQDAELSEADLFGANLKNCDLRGRTSRMLISEVRRCGAVT